MDKQLAVATKPARLLAGDFDNSEPGLAFAEDGVHFFKTAARGFGVKEVDHREYESVADFGGY